MWAILSSYGPAICVNRTETAFFAVSAALAEKLSSQATGLLRFSTGTSEATEHWCSLGGALYNLTLRTIQSPCGLIA